MSYGDYRLTEANRTPNAIILSDAVRLREISFVVEGAIARTTN